jgi:hypothetical protein
MKYLKRFNESWFKNPFSKDKHSGYESPHVKVYGDLSDDKVSLLKAIDICRDKGINLRESSGEITDGADVWTISTSNGILAIKPDYRKSAVKVINLSDNRLISTFDITTPEEISDKICDLLN